VRRLAAALDATRVSRSRIGKERTLAQALASIGRDSDDVALATAVRIAAGRTLAVGDGRTLGVGWSLLADVMRAATGFDDEVLWACGRKTGDMGEAFGLLVARIDGADAREGLPLRDVASLFDALASDAGRAAKRALVDAAFARATPLETKYLAKVLLGDLRIGAQAGVVEGAIARAFDAPIEEVRRAGALVSDLGAVAVLARDRRLAEARLVIGRPLAFMLATPIETVATEIDPRLYVHEDKIDGVRAQLHKHGPDVVVFARGLERVTQAFPEIVSAFAGVEGDVVLDGEIVAVTETGRARPFQALQPRLRKTTPSPEELAETRIVLVAYDLLATEEGDALALPWTERRARLEAWSRDRGPREAFVLNPWSPIPSDTPLAETLDRAFFAARERGHEGLVLKRTDAPYEAGRRGQAWIKVKKAYATLDVVVVAAEEGHGRRAGVLSDYTFAVWQDDELVPIGKAYSGLTDVEIDALTRRFERITTARRGGARLVLPEVVLEVAFDGIQRSTRHASGYSLRFPRIARIRDDKKPEDADRIEAVEAIYRAQIASGHREHAPAPERTPPRKKKKRPPSPQLSLFGDERRRTEE
jgi:DNA ligase-1